MLKAYKYRIYPNRDQKKQIAKTFGCCRFLYNQTLAYRKDAYENEKKPVSRTGQGGGGAGAPPRAAKLFQKRPAVWQGYLRAANGDRLHTPNAHKTGMGTMWLPAAEEVRHTLKAFLAPSRFRARPIAFGSDNVLQMMSAKICTNFIRISPFIT